MMWLLLILLVVVLGLWYAGMLPKLGGAADKFSKGDQVTWNSMGALTDANPLMKTGIIQGKSGLLDGYSIMSSSGELVPNVQEPRLKRVGGNKYAVGAEVIYCNSAVVESASDGKYTIKLKDPANLGGVVTSEAQLSA